MMSGDPYKSPRDEHSETNATPYIVFVAALALVCALAMGLRSVKDGIEWYADTLLIVLGLSGVFGIFRSKISSKILKPYFAFPQIVLNAIFVMFIGAGVLHQFGFNPTLDQIPLFDWLMLITFSLTLARICMIRYEMWSAQQDYADAGTEE